jgi:hypothetical protein
VSANQGKTILMFIDVVDRNLPAIRVVAEFAFGPILTAMEVCMAVLAFIGCIRKIEIGMAVATSYGSMSSAERKARLGVIEPDLVLDHLPIGHRMTGIARKIEFAVRALYRRGRPCCFRSRGAYRQ